MKTMATTDTAGATAAKHDITFGAYCDNTLPTMTGTNTTLTVDTKRPTASTFTEVPRRADVRSGVMATEQIVLKDVSATDRATSARAR